MPLPFDNGAWPATTPNYWSSLFRLAFPFTAAAPQTFNEPILPWTFASVVVNNANSSDPATEQAVVKSESYGRQLGRISDALEYLIDNLSAEERDNKSIQAFLEMKEKIDKIKEQGETARFRKVLSDLDDLRERNKQTFDERVDSINALAKK